MRQKTQVLQKLKALDNRFPDHEKESKLVV